MTGKIPYHYLEWVHQVKERVLSGQTPEPRPPPQNWPIGLLELVRKCWSQRPEDRPNVRTCVESVDVTLSLVSELRIRIRANGSLRTNGVLGECVYRLNACARRHLSYWETASFWRNDSNLYQIHRCMKSKIVQLRKQSFHHQVL